MISLCVINVVFLWFFRTGIVYPWLLAWCGTLGCTRNAWFQGYSTKANNSHGRKILRQKLTENFQCWFRRKLTPGWWKTLFKVSRAWRETTSVCSGLTRLVRAGYSRHDSGASRERVRITRHLQDGSVHMQRSLPSSSYPARSTLTLWN